MDRAAVSDWLRRYVDAWDSYDPEAIGDLFSEDARYRYYPWEAPEVGRDVIVKGWLEKPDEPGTWEAHYEPVAVDGNVAVAVGISKYAATAERPDRTYHNCFVMRFDPEGRCAEFVEYYAKQAQTES